MKSVVPYLSKRMMLSKHTDRFVSLIAWASIVGILLGCLSLTVVIGVISGFEGELAKAITSMHGEILVYTHQEPAQDPKGFEARIRDIAPEATAITTSLISEVMLSGPKAVKGVIFEGIDMGTIGDVTEIPNRMRKGRLPVKPDEVALGSVLAEKLGIDFEGLNEGSPVKVRMILPGFDEATPARSVEFEVSGIFEMGMHDYDSKIAFGLLSRVQEIMGMQGRVSTARVRVPGFQKNPEGLTLISERIRDGLGYPFRAKDWSQLNKNLFYAIKVEKVVIAIIMTIILIVAAFNMVSTLMMMSYDKAKEIAILKAMGFSKRQGFFLFSLIGFGIASVGIGIGIPAGLGVLWVLQTTNLISIPSEVYYINHLPVAIRPVEVGAIAAIAILIGLLATLYPAIQIARKSPLDGIRYD